MKPGRTTLRRDRSGWLWTVCWNSSLTGRKFSPVRQGTGYKLRKSHPGILKWSVLPCMLPIVQTSFQPHLAKKFTRMETTGKEGAGCTKLTGDKYREISHELPLEYFLFIRLIIVWSTKLRYFATSRQIPVYFIPFSYFSGETMFLWLNDRAS